MRLQTSRLVVPCAVALVTALAFLNAAPDAFVLDDQNFLPIPRQEGESLLGTIARLFSGNAWPARRLNVAAYRPLTFATLVLDSGVFGEHRWGFHLTSILLHVAVTVLLYFVLRALLDRGPGSDDARAWFPAAAAAAVFGVHPIHTEAVDSVFNRGDLLVTACVLASVLVVLRFHASRPAVTWGAVAGIYFVALLCKEGAATLPVLVCIVAGAFGVEGSVRQRLRSLAPAAWLLAPLLLFMALRDTALARSTFRYAPLRGTGEALTLSLTAFRDMTGLVVWPHPLLAVRTDYAAKALPVAVAFLVAYAAVVLVAWRRAPGVAAGLAFFAVAVLPTLPVVTNIANAQPLAERYLYLPSVGLAVALAVGFASLERRSGARIAASAAVAAVVVFAPLTFARNRAWHSDLSLFQAEIAATPDNTEAILDLGIAYSGEDRPDDLLALCEKHRQNPRPLMERLFTNCARVLEGRGRFDDAEPYFRAGIGGEAPPADYIVYARYLLRFGRKAEAEQLYERAIETERDPVRQHVTRAEMLLKLHAERLVDALSEIDAALSEDPAFEIAINLKKRIVAALGRAPGSDAPAPAGSPTPAPAPTAAAAPLGAQAVDTLVRVLGRAPAGSPAWIAARADDVGAIARAEELASVFTRAGWKVRALEHTSVPVRPGLFLYGADDQPPAYLETMRQALEEAGLAPTFATGYRSYYEEMSRTKPGFKGFQLAEGEAFLIVVGRTR